jgi:hypothetical protein
MKHIVLLLLVAFSFSAQAQHTGYRFTNQPGNNSYSFINFNQKAIADTAGSTVDTIGLSPFTVNSYYQLTLTDSCQIKNKSLAGCFNGDYLVLKWTKGTGAGVLYLSSDFVVATGTNRIVVTASKKGLMAFIFDGVKWVEVDRNINY